MKKLGLPVLVIIGLITSAIIPSVWIARILSAVMFFGLIAIGRDREHFDKKQMNDYVLLLEITVFIFIVHIAVAHGGVILGD